MRAEGFGFWRYSMKDDSRHFCLNTSEKRLKETNSCNAEAELALASGKATRYVPKFIDEF